MSRRNDTQIGQAILIVIVGLLVVAAAAYYVVSLLAIHLTILFLGSLSSSTSTNNSSPEASAVVAGGASGLFWSSTGALLLAIAGLVWWLAVALATPLAIVVGWEVGGWQLATSYSRARGSLRLGEFRRGRFFVEVPFAVQASERPKHLAVQGPTGSGKTTLLINMILQDISAGLGVAVVDVKDDLIDRILPHIPQRRLDDVILFDVANPIPFNPLSGIPVDRRSLAAAELIAVFRRQFADAWGARLENIFRNVILALLEVPCASLADVPRLLLDPAYLDWVLGHVTNPAVREFFAVEYETIIRRRGDALEPILNKVGPWLTYPELRAVIGSPNSAIDIRRAMDEGKIVLIRVPDGVAGEDVSSLLAGLFVARIQLAAHSRVDTPPARRRPFFLYVDEFQRYASSSFDRILTEARGFGLGLVCANQYPEQLSRELRLAVEHNVATRVDCDYRGGRHVAVVRRLDGSPPFVLRPQGPAGQGNPAMAGRVRSASGAHCASREGGPARGSFVIGPTNGHRPERGGQRARVDVDEE